MPNKKLHVLDKFNMKDRQFGTENKKIFVGLVPGFQLLYKLEKDLNSWKHGKHELGEFILLSVIISKKTMRNPR
jgi:hypothetical protein